MTAALDDLRPVTEAAIRDAMAELASFANSDEFRAVLSELWAVPEEERSRFVVDVLMKPQALADRGVVVPKGLAIQRSAFRDNRPTLFCVIKHLDEGLLWEKVTITFDNPSGEPAIFYDEMVKSARSAAELL